MKIVLTVGILFTGLFTFAQLKTEGVLELDDREEMLTTAVYSLGKAGFVVWSEEIEGKKSELAYYSIDLEKQQTISLETGKKLTDFGMLADQDSTRFLFLHASATKWFIRIFDVESQTLKQEELDKADPFFIPTTCFWLNDKIVMSMSDVLHWRSRILILDLTTGQQDFIKIPGIENKGAVISIAPNNYNEHLSIFFKESNSRKEGVLKVAFLDITGIISDPLTVSVDTKSNLIDGKIIWISKTSFILAGTYASQRFSDTPNGFFFSKWENFKQESIDYYSFGDFGEYISYLPKNIQKFVTEKWKNAGNYLKTKIVLHPVYTTESGYRLIGEVYYPYYEYVTKKYTNLLGTKKWEKEVREFQGYNYTHAAILDINEQGVKIDDYCFSLKSTYLPREVSSRVRVYMNSQKNMKMEYVQRNGMYIHEIVDGEVLTTELKGTLTNVNIAGKSSPDIHYSYWYDNNYLVYGFKTIELKPEGLILDAQKAKTIFFVKKMSYVQ